MAYTFQHADFDQINKTLTEDMAGFNKYCKQWRLIPNKTKTIVSCFHLNNQAANKELNVTLDGKILEHKFHPTYLGVKTDRSLTFNQNATQLAAKLSTRNNLLQKLTGTSWAATASCLKISALGLVYSTAEYCCAAWLNSNHTDKVDAELNRTMRLITGTVQSTPVEWLPVLSRILPPHIRRQKALVKEYQKIVNNEFIPLQNDLLNPPPTRLKSRNPPLVTAKNLLDSDFDPITVWKSEIRRARIYSLLFDFDYHLTQTEELTLPRKAWRNLNRLRTGHGRCNEMLHKWGYIDDPSCCCGNPYQTMNHVLLFCPVLAYKGELQDIVDLKEEAVEWLNQLEL